jgi:phosphoglycolate phosphatase-like HAD superfamily hydrolase
MDKFQDIRGAAFDLDGTLVDSAPGLTAAVDRRCMRWNCRLPEKNALSPGLATVLMY